MCSSASFFLLNASPYPAQVMLENLMLDILPRKGEQPQKATYVPHGMIIHHGNTMDRYHTA
jgi:hypothetical protein